jgi:predicted metal-dependent HD superfamily phosphohydrolase
MGLLCFLVSDHEPRMQVLENFFHGVYQEICNRLEAELPEHVKYHTLQHTLDVLETSVMIGKEEQVSERDIMLLKIAALFHDTGYLVQRQEHEATSCRIFRSYADKTAIREEDKLEIEDLIMATKIPQTPKNHLAQVLCDADLDYLGRDDFKTISENLFLELQAYKEVKDREHWYSLQVWFLTKQMFFTNFSKANRSLKLAQNLEYAKTLCI